MADAERKQRTTAKRKFTRCYNRLNTCILNNEETDIIISKFNDLKKFWDNVQSTHDSYLFATNADIDENTTDDDAWITDIEEKFELIQKLQCDYVRETKEKDIHDTKIKTEEKLYQESNEIISHCIKNRDASKILLQQEIKGIEELIKIDKSKLLKTQIIAGTKDVKLQLEKCKELHTSLLSHLDVHQHEDENKWLEGIYILYKELNNKVYKYIEAVTEMEKEAKRDIGLKMERLKMPSFDGDIRKYSKFKSDFMKQVEVQVKSSDNLVYILRSCLSGSALLAVESIDNYSEIWERLDKRYGQPSFLIDIIMNEIKEIPSVMENDSKGFIQFVNIIERGYTDLKRLSLQQEMSNSVTVSMLEGRLPPTIRRDWAKEVSKSDSKVKLHDKFPFFMDFLKEQRSTLEYEMANLRISDSRDTSNKTGYVNYGTSFNKSRNENPNLYIPDITDSRNTSNSGYINYGTGFNKSRNGNPNFKYCVLHKSSTHSTSECTTYLNKPVHERFNLIKEVRGCWSCLQVGHRMNYCRNKKPCSINDCKFNHHPTLHDVEADKVLYSVNANTDNSEQRVSTKCLLPLMKIKCNDHAISVLWDSGATISLITFKKAKQLNLKGKRVELSVVTVGGKIERKPSVLYELPLYDKQNKIVNVKVYGINIISQEHQSDNIDSVIYKFKGVNKNEILRPEGEIDVLIGFNYALLHPRVSQSSNNLMLLENRFGKCIGGSHQTTDESCEVLVDGVEVFYIAKAEEHFFEIEEMGVQCSPLCGNCSCKKCALGSKGLSIEEEREQNLINQGLTYLQDNKCFVAAYPWIRDPSCLPDNYFMARRRLECTERRLLRNPDHLEVYHKQIVDMLDRKVARILTEEEIKKYNGPYYYLCHHEVLKDSLSTPCRIVFNSSAKFMNSCLNDFWAKGAKMINNLLGVLLRFRENKIVIIGDIQKMYHSVKITIQDQHTHRFLWRNLETNREPDIYVMTSVSFGDKPAGNIAMAALHKTAEMWKHVYPRAAETILKNTYVDDIIDSFPDKETAKSMTQDVDEILSNGGFSVKHWTTSINNNDQEEINNNTKMFSEDDHKVLGMMWEKFTDEICYKVKLKGANNNITDNLTKRKVLSEVNSIFDPLGLITPFTVKAKILMKNLWKQKLEWDDELQGLARENFCLFLTEMVEMQDVMFKRCLKPEHAVDDPILITFSDASNEALGACCYLRWKLDDNSYWSTLIAAKNRVAPMKVLSIVRLELCAAVIAKRLAQFIQQELRFKIQKRYFFIDSQIVRSMIAKESYAFATFVAVRLGEIHQSTSVDEWHWLDTSNNVADCITRGLTPCELKENSIWQRGPAFLYKPEEEWPIKQEVVATPLPEENKTTIVAHVSDVKSIENLIDISDYSQYLKLINMSGRLISVFRYAPKPSLTNILKFPSDFIIEAEMIWIIEAQKLLKDKFENGDFKQLCPIVRDDGIIIVSGRVEEFFSDSYNSLGLILLPYSHRISLLYATFIHNLSHLGTASTVCKIRRRFWIIKLTSMVNSIRNKCVTCRKLNRQLQQQLMAQIPLHRLKPSPAFHYTYIDLFGPFKVKGVVHKRSTGKAFGVIFTCSTSRAVYCDISQNYSTDGFLQTLRRFTSIRGYPSEVWSDCGSQLVAAHKELREMIKGFDEDKLRQFGAHEGLKWHFSPPDAPWHNGCAESLIKSVKKALKVAIGEQILSFPELQTVMFEAANIVNERPIGVKNKNIDDGNFLCPNNLILGRASIRVPSGPFTNNPSFRKRNLFIQKLADAFWKVWLRDYFPCLMIRQKWHIKKRQVCVGDVVIVKDANAIRGDWQIGQVEKVYCGNDQICRKVDVRYKVPINKKCSIMRRAVQSIVVLLPTEEDTCSS